ncbi:hypothetical protein HDV02_005383 [Globomyces sp. JEL0801]|nr:hypothetical protein HDV02_005383 [Globomyces sp. JEL0801]
MGKATVDVIDIETIRPIFVYGSLMADAVFKKITKIDNPKKLGTGILKGYKRVQVMSAPYPAILKEDNSEVVGFLYDIPNIQLWDLLDQYESDLYKRITVDVILQQEKGIQSVKADVYLWNANINQLSQLEWDYDDFVKNKLPGWDFEA